MAFEACRRQYKRHAAKLKAAFTRDLKRVSEIAKYIHTHGVPSSSYETRELHSIRSLDSCHIRA